jgi:hypothetical protein
LTVRLRDLILTVNRSTPAYLLRNPANADRLLAAIERARRGEFEQHGLLDA